MAKRLMDLIRSAVPLSKEHRKIMEAMARFLENSDLKEIRGLVKHKKVDLAMKSLDISPQIEQDRIYPSVTCLTDDNDITAYIGKINDRISSSVKESVYRKFSQKASEIIPKFIGMNIVGLEMIKQAAGVQLFARHDEPVHILLLGDPGTGKTDLLRSAAALHPVSSFGLGSGTTGVGLTVTVKGDEVSKGLLPLADKGICAIDELNLMQEKDRASLYNAMEKGFLTYDKRGKHYKFDARVKIIATANPKGDKFAGWTVETLKKQLPFDSALLSRFHLVFLIRKPDVRRFIEISKRIVRDDRQELVGSDERFIQDYIAYAEKIDVQVPTKLEQQIIDFIAEIKKNEKKYLIEISPRIVLGFMRLAKASARMRLANEVSEPDITTVKEIVTRGLRLDH
jgi:replicative DNA helicase Mcm